MNDLNQPKGSAAGSTLAVGSALHWPCPHNCLSWCRTDGSKTNHHPRCEYVDESLMTVWRFTHDGSSYVTDRRPSQDALREAQESEVLVAEEKMHREIYDHLKEFAGF